jgi:hypothetical protein
MTASEPGTGSPQDQSGEPAEEVLSPATPGAQALPTSDDEDDPK